MLILLLIEDDEIETLKFERVVNGTYKNKHLPARGEKIRN